MMALLIIYTNYDIFYINDTIKSDAIDRFLYHAILIITQNIKSADVNMVYV